MDDATQIKVQNHIKNLWDTVITAEHNHDIWWIYKSKDTRSKFLETMNDYVSFFQSSIHAHFVAMIIALYRLYETRRDTINIPRLLQLLEQHHSLSDDAVTSINDLIAQAKPIWIKVGIIRSDIFAHLTNERSIEESFDKAEIKYGQFKELIELSKKITNAIGQGYNRNTHAFNLTSEIDTKALLTDLWNYRDLKIAKNNE